MSGKKKTNQDASMGLQMKARLHRKLIVTNELLQDSNVTVEQLESFLGIPVECYENGKASSKGEIVSTVTKFQAQRQSGTGVKYWCDVGGGHDSLDAATRAVLTIYKHNVRGKYRIVRIVTVAAVEVPNL